MSEPSLPDSRSRSDAPLMPPAMPQIDQSKLTRLPVLFVDSAQLRHTLGWQRWSGMDDRACFIVCRLTAMAGIKVVDRFPLTEAGWNQAWTALRDRDAASAQLLLELRERRLADAEHAIVLAPPPPPRFPSSAETRRNILNEIARGNEKYARPFDRGKVAHASFVGTESWSDYGNVVLQMAILDTMLSIEQKLSILLQTPSDDPTD